jgi:hypothetical protein
MHSFLVWPALRCVAVRRERVRFLAGGGLRVDLGFTEWRRFAALLEVPLTRVCVAR